MNEYFGCIYIDVSMYFRYASTVWYVWCMFACCKNTWLMTDILYYEKKSRCYGGKQWGEGLYVPRNKSVRSMRCFLREACFNLPLFFFLSPSVWHLSEEGFFKKWQAMTCLWHNKHNNNNNIMKVFDPDQRSWHCCRTSVYTYMHSRDTIMGGREAVWYDRCMCVCVCVIFLPES